MDCLGNSYASGVGAGDYIFETFRCLRYDQAYPLLVNADPELGAGPHVMNNCVCSGAELKDVELYQMLDKSTSGVPSIDYGARPAFGNPHFATLIVGGDDIDFPDTDDLIKKVVKKGRSGTICDNFRLFVTGYAQFFNEVDTACDTVTFASTANPNSDGKPHTMTTKDLRKYFNKMSRALNAVILKAVTLNANTGVEFVDIEGEGVDGHRFCEPGIAEQDQTNPNIYFYHYPYNMPEQSNYSQIIDAAYQRATQGINDNVGLNAKFPTTNSLSNAVFDAIDWTQLGVTNASDKSNTPIVDPFFRDTIGPRVKVFHPQVNYHTFIKNIILRQSGQDNIIASSISASTSAIISISSTTPPSSPTPVPVSVPERLDCTPVGGNTWGESRDVATSNIDDFCSQSLRSVGYNQGTANDLIYTVSYQADSSKTLRDASDCHNRLANIVIDGCDGTYGGTYTATDGWVYMMEPKAIHNDEDSCDITWEFALDVFEIRGKNFPDAKLGMDGSGLLQQLQGCSRPRAITGWSFEMTPHDPVYQWYARENIIIGRNACVGRAVESAGGTSASHC